MTEVVVDNSDANSRINGYWERVCMWLCGGAIALLCLVYQDQKVKVEKLEEKVQFLYMDKVSKQDMDKLEERIMKGISAGNSDIIARIELLRQIDLPARK